MNNTYNQLVQAVDLAEKIATGVDKNRKLRRRLQLTGVALISSGVIILGAIAFFHSRNLAIEFATTPPILLVIKWAGLVTLILFIVVDLLLIHQEYRELKTEINLSRAHLRELLEITDILNKELANNPIQTSGDGFGYHVTQTHLTLLNLRLKRIKFYY